MIPISDENPTLRIAVATWLLLAALLCMWVLVQGASLDERTLAMSVCNLGMVPAELTRAVPLGTGVPIAPGLTCVVDDQPINWATPVISMFLHGGWGHLLSNALFLFVFGNNVEDVMGRGRFLLFYLLCGIAAAVAHVVVSPGSPVPTVGASGAISGIMGAYLMQFPRVRVRMYFPPIFIVALPAWLVLLWWFAIQVLMGLPQLAELGEVSGGIAVWAHIGGFVAGAVLVRLFERRELIEARRSMLLRRGLLQAI